MSESETFSLVIRVIALFGLGALFALSGWWGLKGPTFGLGAVAAAIFFSVMADVARNTK